MSKDDMISNRSGLKLFPLLLQLWGHLNRRRRLQLAQAVMLMLASSVAEAVSLSAIIPFLALLADPQSWWQQPQLKYWSLKLGIVDPKDLLLIVTITFVLAALSSGAIRMLNLWINSRLVAAIGSDLSCEAYLRTLYQPYATHVARNSSRLISSISSDLNRTIILVINPLLTVLSSGLIALGLLVVLFAVNWGIALGSGLLIIFLYAFAIAAGKKSLQQNGLRQVKLNSQIIQALQEGLGAIRDVLLDGSQRYYVNLYREADQPLRRTQTHSLFLSAYPRILLEPLALAIIAIVGYLMEVQGAASNSLPLLGLLALGGQRLLPMAQKIYEGWAQSRSAKGSLANILDVLAQPLPSPVERQVPVPLILKRDIRFDNVSFRYSESSSCVIDRLNLEIRKGQRIGLIGTTGSGKSTVLDLLMGLLKPTEGRILIDGCALKEYKRLASWRASIAHVPQNIYLADSSIAENIAFGVPKDQIDMSRVINAAEQAQIDGFIQSTKDSYATFVGEKGIRLSGGQRQRLVIARALYKEAQVLVFDEATSALDTTTESIVMESINNLSHDLTVILIAHRLSTLEHCDRVIRLENGQIVADGPPHMILTPK